MSSYRCAQCDKVIRKLTANCKIEADLEGYGWTYYCEECTFKIFGVVPKSPKFLASAVRVGVRFRYRNKRNKRRVLAASCDVAVSEDTMIITSRRVMRLIQQGLAHKLDDLPRLGEENFHLIKDIAKERRVPWWYLLDVAFNLENITSEGFKHRLGMHASKNLILHVITPFSPITLEMSRKKWNARTPPLRLIKVNDAVVAYWKKQHNEEFPEVQEPIDAYYIGAVPPEFGFEEKFGETDELDKDSEDYPFEVLGLSSKATWEEIQAKYVELESQFNPAIHQDIKETEFRVIIDRKYREINKAYNILKGKLEINDLTD